MSEASPAVDPDRIRRAIRIAAAVTALVAAGFYAKKAADDGSAFIRWRPQVLELCQERNIAVYRDMMFPNPPIMPLTLYPLMLLPPLAGAMAWFALKVGMTVASVGMCLAMARESGRRIPAWVEGLILLLSLRPILSDLHHGNNNLLILFLIVSSLYAWRKGYDVLAGIVLALAITYKVTPALFVPYFLSKRSWRTVGATALGGGLFLLVVPSLFFGPAFNGECLGMWWHRILSPFVVGGFVSPQEMNQSMVGVLTRLLTQEDEEVGRYVVQLKMNLAAWDPALVSVLVKGLSLGLLGLLFAFCRTRTGRRDDPRLLGEFALVVLTMLFVSERSWKHHYVTLLLPYTYLACRLGRPDLPRPTRRALAATLAASALLMATTSSELGGVLADGEGHKIAQFYGMFLWSGVVLYLATAWRVVVEGRSAPAGKAGQGPPAPHFASISRRPAAG